MAYTLTLTNGERKAIDWVGDRYAHGHDFYKMLCDCEWQVSGEPEGLEIDWSSQCDISFVMSEPIAWEISEFLAEAYDDDKFACFSGELVSKLLNFMGAIV